MTDAGFTKVSVVGSGNVGAAITNALALLRTCDRVVLYDRNLARAEGQAWDVEDCIPLFQEMDVTATSDWEDLQDSAIVVISVGFTPPPGTSRLNLLRDNAKIVLEVVRHLDAVCPDSILILVSNPVDLLTRVVMENSSRPQSRILGSGTLLDTTRLRYQLGHLLQVDHQDLHLYVIGEHGSSMFPVWSSATVGSIPLQKFPLPAGQSLRAVQKDLEGLIRTRGGAIHQRKGYTNFGVAAAVHHIIGCILWDEKRILTVPVKPRDEYEIGTDVVLSLPCVVGRSGVERQLILPMALREKKLLNQSAEILRSAMRE